MTYRKIIILLIVALSLLALAACGGKKADQPKAKTDQLPSAKQWAEFPIPEPDYNAKLPRDFSPFEEAMVTLSDERRAELDAFTKQASIEEIQAAFEKGDLTSEELTIYYLDRIKRYDVDHFNSVLMLNPQALEDARALDAERASGKIRGSMHGIPVLAKDNIAIMGLPTAAGAYAMKDWAPDQDAAVIAAIRDAGAVILGKTNLSEWANFMSSQMPNGFSVLGGQTRNPYGPFDTLGSSSGSAVAASADFAVVTIGSETQGSLLMPASYNSAVALKPTHALVSGENVIPLVPFQDNAGPMGRNVYDVAALLTAMVSPAPGDAEAVAHAGEDYTQALTLETVKGMRVGLTSANDDLVAALQQTGMDPVVIDAKDLPQKPPEIQNLMPAVFKASLNAFLPKAQAPVKSLEEVIAVNKEDMKNRAPYGQDYLEFAQNTSVSPDELDKQVQTYRQASIDLLTKVFDKYQVAVIIQNDQYGGSPMLQHYAPAGWPALVLPIGYDQQGKPQAFGFVARPYEEGKMLATAAIIESLIHAWQPPNLDATIQMLDEKLDDKK